MKHLNLMYFYFVIIFIHFPLLLTAQTLQDQSFQTQYDQTQNELSVNTSDGFKTNEFERNALAEYRLDDYYNSRILRGDKYGLLAKSVIHNSGFLGKVANFWLKFHFNLLPEYKQVKILQGRSWKAFSRQVNINIAYLHAQTVDDDYIGIPGLLSAAQISEYHEEYFKSLGLPANTFGGSAFYFRTKYWCHRCDPVPAN